jgi:hypothetical protein
MKLSLSHKTIGKNKRLVLSEIGGNPDIDWVLVVNVCILVLIVSVWYSFTLFRSISEERVTVESVQVENIDLNKKGMDEVMSKYILKSQSYRDIVSGGSVKIPEPSL